MEANLTNLVPGLIANCVMMINQMIANGHKPLMFFMSDNTRRAILDSFPWKRKWYHRLFRLKRKHPALVALHGVPIVPNAYMPDGMVHLQALPYIVPGQPGFFAPGQGFQPEALPQEQGGAPAQPVQGQQSPFWKPVAQQVVPEPEKAPTLDDLSQNNGRPSPSDILMKAFDGVEKVKHIAVLQETRNGDVYATCNIDNTTLIGFIEKMRVWAYTQER